MKWTVRLQVVDQQFTSHGHPREQLACRVSGPCRVPLGAPCSPQGCTGGSRVEHRTPMACGWLDGI